MHYISQRWLGGTLTNYDTIKKRIDKLHELNRMEEDGTMNSYPKKEIIQLKGERDKLEKFLGGIKNMTRIPDLLFIIDPKKEKIAIQEAHILGIPTIAVIDTNCDPDEIDFPIPGNDDAIRAVKLLTETLANAVIEGKQGEVPMVEEAEEVVETEEPAEETMETIDMENVEASEEVEEVEE